MNNSNMYKVTLSMPIYNVADYVERALLSALNQTFESIEFLIVDDCGTDNSMDIVRRVVAEHPRGKDVRIIEHPQNIGTGATKNTAIDNAKGEYLFFMDSDDEITSDCIEVLYKAMMEEPVDFVAGSYDRRKLNNQIIPGFHYPTMKIVGNSDIMSYQYKGYSPKITVFTWNKLYDISFLRRNNIKAIPNHINEDVTFTPQVIFNASSCYLLSHITLVYNIRENSISDIELKSLSWKHINQKKEIVLFLQSLLNKSIGKSIYPYLLRRFICYMALGITMILKSNCIDDKSKRNIVQILFKLNLPILEVLRVIPVHLKSYFALLIVIFPYSLKKLIILLK